MTRLRLFVALDLPAPAVEALVRFRDAAADPEVWRPLAAATFHVTLAFLGHRPEEDVEPVRAALSAVAVPGPPELALGDALLLPPRRARVLTVTVVDGSGALGGLQARVAGALSDAGVFEPEARPFRPHVTVARLRPGGVRAPRTVDVAPEPVAFAGGPLVLYRSHVRRGGAMYEPLVTRRV